MGFKYMNNQILSILRTYSISSIPKRGYSYLNFLFGRKLKNRLRDIIGYYPLKEKNMPYIVQIEPTSFCNLRCNMCLRTIKQIKGSSLKFEDMKQIIDQLEGTREVLLQGYGEPLLNPDIFRMIEYCKNKGLRTVLITNGMILNRENIEKLISSGLDWLKISFDAITPYTYSKIRKGINVKKLLSNLQQLSEILNQKKPLMGVSFQTVISRININEVPLILEFLTKNRFRNIEIQGVIEWNKNTPHITVEQYKILNGIILKFRKSTNLKITLTIEKTPEKRLSKGKICKEPWTTAFIDTEGNVIACPLGCFGKELYMGNVFKKPFKEIWNDEPYIQLRRELKSGNYREICRKFCY